MKIQPLRVPTDELELLRRRSGSKEKMLRIVDDWFNNTYRNTRKTAIITEDYVKSVGLYFHPVKFYYYKYNPLTKDKLMFYDKEPLMLSLGQKKTKRGLLELGINFHFIPERMRRLVLDLVFKIYEPIIQNNYKQIKRNNIQSQAYIKPEIVYPKLKEILQTTGWMFAIRSYYHFQMETKPKIISYEDWNKVIVLNSEKIIGANPKQIFSMYYDNRRNKK